ncbi:uncharacterized protein LACBIDRAFT_303958, partial [Laccaria bicolor S238N-H82]
TYYRAMHADRMIKQHMAGSYTDGASTEPSTTPSQLCRPSASSSARLTPKGGLQRIVSAPPISQDILPDSNNPQRQFTQIFISLLSEHNAECTTVSWTTWPNMAFKLKKVIVGWDSDVVDIAFCRAFAYGKISNKQWRHLSRLILEGVLTIKDWTAEQKQIPETDARFGEIPVVLNLRGLPMVFIKDSSNWVRQNCKIDSATPYTPCAPSAASSPALLSSKKRTYEDLSLVTEENARREHRSVSTPAQNEMEPSAKRQRHVTFSSLPMTMFYMKHRQEQLLQKSTARHSPFNQPSSSSSSQATLASKPPANQVTKSILGGRYKGSDQS